MGADAGRCVADPFVFGVGSSAEEREACVERGECGLQLDGFVVLGQMKGAEEFEVFKLDLSRRVDRCTDGEGGVNVSRAGEDDVPLHAVILEPWMGCEVEGRGPNGLRRR